MFNFKKVLLIFETLSHNLEISAEKNYNYYHKEGFMVRVVSFLSILAVLAVVFVLFSCSLSPSPSSDGSIYVSTSGNDANDGLSPSKPVRTLVKAVEIANTMDKAANVVIKVGSGVYTPGSGLSSSGSGFVINRPNIVISGGWNSDFSSVEGKSELDGNNSLYHVVMIKDVTNVKLENLVIRGGNANSSDPDDRGGGIYVSNVSYLVIESNVVISNNSANWWRRVVFVLIQQILR
jgi:hypothetical protein